MFSLVICRILHLGGPPKRVDFHGEDRQTCPVAVMPSANSRIAGWLDVTAAAWLGPHAAAGSFDRAFLSPWTAEAFCSLQRVYVAPHFRQILSSSFRT